MPQPQHCVMISRGKWLAEERCADRADAPRALADLRSRFADWWKPNDPPKIEFGTTDGRTFTLIETLTDGRP